MQRLRLSPSRPVCHSSENETSAVCVSGSRPASVEAECLSTPVGPSVCLCLPAVCFSRVLASTGLSLVLVTSLWLQKEWFANFLSLLVDKPLKLPQVWNLLVQSHVKG